MHHWGVKAESSWHGPKGAGGGCRSARNLHIPCIPPATNPGIPVLQRTKGAKTTMAGVWGVYGVPMALQRDGWWLADDPVPPVITAFRPRRRAAVLVGLVVLADVLFWGQGVGLSLALFAGAVYSASLLRRPAAAPLGIMLLGALPVVDHVQPLSVLFLIGGLITAITLNRAATTQGLLLATLGLARCIPLGGVRGVMAALRQLRLDLNATSPLRQMARAWAFPVGGTLILMALLVQANPILDHWLSDLPPDPGPWVQRGLFWSGVALILWPLMTTPPAPMTMPRPGTAWPRLGLNGTSVSHALITFNAVLGVQTLLDARYLWSGAALPPGMSLAEYAHRGAYPLLATALLAGAFALAARPWVAERRALKPLLILWLVQNILLTLSALYRLDLYVVSFGLTYLRLHALIWMALVAAGLALTLAQIAAARTNLWLLTRCTLMGVATLYACAFINFADLIARTNVAMGKIDPLYLCQLGPTAAASLPPIAWRVKEPMSYGSNFQYCTLTPPAAQTWRNWGFRNWLVLRNLARQEAPT